MSVTFNPTLPRVQQTDTSSPLSPAATTAAAASMPATGTDGFDNITSVLQSGGILPTQSTGGTSSSSGSGGSSADQMKKMMDAFIQQNMQTIMQMFKDQQQRDASQYPAV